MNAVATPEQAPAKNQRKGSEMRCTIFDALDCAWRGFNRMAASAGLNERALKAERMTEIAIVTANC